MEMEEPVLISQRSITFIVLIAFIVVIALSIGAVIFGNSSTYFYFLSCTILLAIGILYFNYYSVPQYFFYNDSFVEKRKLSSTNCKILYSEIKQMNTDTQLVRLGTNLTIGPNSAQNETLNIVLFNGNIITFEEVNYDNFKLIKKLFTELSEKDDTSRLN